MCVVEGLICALHTNIGRMRLPFSHSIFKNFQLQGRFPKGDQNDEKKICRALGSPLFINVENQLKQP